MRNATKLFTLILLLSIASCTSWPPRGQGGMAEHNLQFIPKHPLGPEHGLYFEQDLSARHLDILILRGADVCFPASVKIAQTREDRIARQLQGGLHFDASNDLIIQRDQLEQLERQLDYVKLHADCDKFAVAPEHSDKSETEALTTINDDIDVQTHTLVNTDLSESINIIEALLNSDNQFAHDSAELNPKYIENLTQACLLINDFSAYKLVVIGHTDTTGEFSHNEILSMARAQQVAHFLVSSGLHNDHITIDAIADVSPLYAGNQPEINLVNRRVSITLTHVSY
jgi:outer membrane protein OmpA-like peptidoglycan-associated protein